MGVISGSLTKVSSTTTQIVFSWNLTTSAAGLIYAQVVGDGQVFLIHDGSPTKPFTGSGTATGLQPGTGYLFTWGAQDSDDVTASGSYTFYTDNAPPPTFPPVWTDQTLGGFVAGSVYSDGVSATNSPTYSVISGALPTGISLNSSTGAVTGTPTVSGQSYSFTIRAANVDGNVTAAFSGTVAVPVSAGKWRVWTGSAWVVAPLKVWNGSAWVDSSVKVWNGSAWVTSV